MDSQASSSSHHHVAPSHGRTMPAKGSRGPRSQSDIDTAVKRHLEGRESVVTLCREFKISRAGFYLWVKKYKEDVMRRSMRAGMKPHDVERSDKSELIAEIESLRAENRKLRDRLVAEMMKSSS